MARPSHSHYDVVVVGARVAGAATALELARAGLDVLVLDREAPGNGTLSTHALMRGGVVRLEQLGVLDDVAAAGAPPIEQVVFHYGDTVETVDLHGRGALYAPTRRVLDRILVGAARAAGAEIRHRAVVDAVHRDATTGRVTGVLVRDLDAPDDPAAVHEIAARHVVGADGRTSTLARLVDAPIDHRGMSSGAAAFRYVDGHPAAGYEWSYRPGSGAGVIPTDGGRTCVWVGVPTPRFLAERHVGAEAWFDRTLAATAPQVAALVDGLPHGRTWAFAGEPSLVRTPVGPGWSLVGDASAFRDPITSHGITDALRDAGALAAALTDHLRDGADEAETLADYRRVRDRFARPIVDVTDRIAAHTWDLAQLRELLLELSAVMRAETEHLHAGAFVAA